MGNLDVCRKAILGVFRDAVVAHVRARFDSEYGEAAAARLHASLKDHLARAKEHDANRRATLLDATADGDDFDLIEVANLATLLDGHFLTLVPSAKNDSTDQRKKRQASLKEHAKNVTAMRNAFSHGGRELPFRDAYGRLSEAQRILEAFDLLDAARQIDALCGELEGAPGRLSRRARVGIGIATVTLAVGAAVGLGARWRLPDHSSKPIVTSEPSPGLPPTPLAPWHDLLPGSRLDALLSENGSPRTVPADCTVQLVGAASNSGEVGAESGRCATTADLAGLSRAEAEFLERSEAPSAKGPSSIAFRAGAKLTSAQLRSGLRAGALSPDALAGAASEGEAPTVIQAAVSLTSGSHAFARLQSTRRSIAAVIRDDCSGLDPARVRQYSSGGFSLAELDRAASVRVAHGKCLGSYIASERRLQSEFLGMTGALAGFGLDISSRASRQADPDDPRTFAIYRTRSSLSPSAARLGVQLANALTKTETYFSNIVAVTFPGDGASPWGTALVWSNDGVVDRLVVNLLDPAQATRECEGHYGKPLASPSTEVRRWRLPSGHRLELDVGPRQQARITLDGD